MITTITKFKTADKTLFDTLHSAVMHEEDKLYAFMNKSINAKVLASPKVTIAVMEILLENKDKVIELLYNTMYAGNEYK